MKLPPGLRPGTLAFLAIWFVLLAGGRSSFLRDPGTFWHIATGQRILAEGFIRSDPYTFTFAGTWWVPYQWLGEVVMALVYRAGGFDLLLLGAATLIAAIFAWPAARLSRIGLNPLLVGMIAFMALAASTSHFHIRPHLFTMAGMVITMVVLVEVEAGRMPVPRMICLVPFFVIWVNVHGGVLGGMATVALATGGWLTAWAIGLPTPVKSRRDALWAIGIAATCCLAAFVNPYGLDLIRTWAIIMGEPLLRLIIQEHSPLSWREPGSWPILAFAGLYFLVLAGAPPREWRATWLLPVVWFFLTLDRVRHAPLFALTGLVGVASIWPCTRWARWLAAHRPDWYRPEADEATARARATFWASLAIPGVLVLLAMGLQLARIPVPVVGAGWARHDPRHWPVELIEVLKQHEPPPGSPANHLFNDYIDGGFVIFHAPGYKVFVDDRCEVFGGDWLLELVAASSQNTEDSLKRWQSQYGPFDFALTRLGTRFDEYFSSRPGEWDCVKRGETAAFYVRKRGRNPTGSE